MAANMPPAMNKAVQKAARGTLVDRYVSWRDPVKGLQRRNARVQMAVSGSYIGASRTRRPFRNWFVSGKSADADLLPELPTLRARSRDMVRNNPLAAGAINTVTTNVVGTGLRMQSSIALDILGMTEDQATDWQNQTEFEWRLLAESKDIDLRRRLNFAGLQELAFRNTLENGDGFAALPMVATPGQPYKTRVQLIEGDRVCNKASKQDSAALIAGVHLNTHGAATAYDILKAHPGALNKKANDWVTVQARGKRSQRLNIIHLYEVRRPDQTRGMPYLAPVIEPLKQLGRYTEAELTAAVVSGMFTVFIKTPEGRGSMMGANEVEGSTDADRDYELGSGAVLEGLPGDEVQTIDPGRPNQAFDPFVQAILRQVGVALELPFEVLIKHYTSSYTAARAALLEAWKFYRKRRVWLASNFCQPVYETWLHEAVSTGRINAPGFLTDPRIRKAYCMATWHGDGMGVLDPGREATASETRMNIGITTLPEEIAAYDGGDWDAKHRVQTRVTRARREEGLDTNHGGEPINPPGIDSVVSHSD